MQLIVPTINCCPIEVCHTSCAVLGHLTVWGWLVVLSVSIGIAYILQKLPLCGSGDCR